MSPGQQDSMREKRDEGGGKNERLPASYSRSGR